MKYFVVALIIALVSFPVFAEEHSLTQAPYNLTIEITGSTPAVGAGSNTKQVFNGISFPQYTVAYAAAVDLLNELNTKIWLAASVGIPEAQVQAWVDNPKSIICP